MEYKRISKDYLIITEESYVFRVLSSPQRIKLLIEHNELIEGKLVSRLLKTRYISHGSGNILPSIKEFLTNK